MNDTLGPWTVTKRPASKRPAVVVVDADRNEVCEAYAYPELIAAAPDLLMFLRDARQALFAGDMERLEAILAGDWCSMVVESIESSQETE